METNNQGGQPQGQPNGGNPANPFNGLSEQQIKDLSGQAYRDFQSRLDTATAEAKRWKEAHDKLEGKFSKFDNIEDLERRASQAEALKFEAEAMAARNRIIAEKFPQLKGKESFVRLGTEAEMTQFAEQLVKEFNLGAPSGTPQPGQGQGSPSVDLKGAANGGGGDNTELINSLGNLSEEQLKETLAKLPMEELAKIVGGSGSSSGAGFDSPYSRSLAKK